MQRRRLAPVLAVIGGAIVIVIALVVASYVGGKKSGPDTSNLNIDSINEMLSGIPQQGIALGNPRATVTMVEFGDLQCTACAGFSANVVPYLIQNYVRPGKLRIEFAGMAWLNTSPSGDSARLMRMALAAGQQKKLWNFIELVYANQGAEESGYATDSYLKSVASAAGVNVNKAFTIASPTSAFAASIKANGARFDKLKFGGTPSFLLARTGSTSPEKISTQNVPSYQDLAKRINALLKS
ncbi:MAG: thioredoxin domain-containing protein [Gaiellaceae bacterium]|jgi:protein-disulfide isomerase